MRSPSASDWHFFWRNASGRVGKMNLSCHPWGRSILEKGIGALLSLDGGVGTVAWEHSGFGG